MVTFRLEGGRFSVKLGKIPGERGECYGILSLFLLAAALIASSWRKWLDPQVDYGRELYIPWRMLEGGKLFKDVDDLYGPLSRFIDFGLFKVFGPGMMVLAWANIAIYGVTLGLIYYLFRKAWGYKTALLTTFIFVGVFSFSQLVITSNYNFVTPYSQQVTHGFLVCLVLLAILPNWIESVSVKGSFYVGLCVGLTFVLKPEFILASGLILSVSFVFRFKKVGFPKINELLGGISGIILPTALLALYFVSYMSFSHALAAASHAWMNGLILGKDENTTHLLNNFSGLDQPTVHLVSHVKAAGIGLALLLVIGILAWLIGIVDEKLRLESKEAKLGMKDFVPYLLAGLLFAGLVWVALNKVNWVEVGPALIGILCLLSLWKALGWIKSGLSNEIPKAEVLKALLVVFAGALMIRMLLNGRIYQYGFIQASVATLVIVALLFNDVGSWLKRLGKGGQTTGVAFQGSILVLSVMAVALIMTQSQRLLDAKILAIGEARDLFYSFPVQVSGQGELVRTFSSALSKRPNTETLLVLPEGIMVNYLARKKSPVLDLTLYTNKETEARIVQALEKNRPDWIVVLSRDLTEYGVTRYGSKGQSGEQIISWMKDKYKVSASQGGDPLDAKQVGGIIYGSIKTVIK